MSEGRAVGLPHRWRWWHSLVVALRRCLQQFLEELTQQGLLVFGLSWVLTHNNYSQELPFILRAVGMFCEHTHSLPASQSKTNIVKGETVCQPRPCAPLTHCSFFFLDDLCFPISSCIPFNDALYGLLACVTGAACSLMKQQQPRCKVSPAD